MAAVVALALFAASHTVDPAPGYRGYWWVEVRFADGERTTSGRGRIPHDPC